MLKRCGDQAALKESAARADELAVAGDPQRFRELYDPYT